MKVHNNLMILVSKITHIKTDIGEFNKIKLKINTIILIKSYFFRLFY